MKFHKTKLDGLLIIDLELREDPRGYFARSFCQHEFAQAGVEFTIRQMNRSMNVEKGTIRGMHFQRAPKAEAKVVTVLRGKVWDVAVDVRPDSPTFGQFEAVELDEHNKRMFYIPEGFAHGYQTLEPNTELQYLMSEFYSAEHAFGVRWNDPDIGIHWPLPDSVLSEADKTRPLLKDLKTTFEA